MTTTLLNSFYDISITKNNIKYTRDGSSGSTAFPEFFNCISKLELAVKTGEIVTIDITLTPSFDDAMYILKSGLLGINMGSKDQKPDSPGANISASNSSTSFSSKKGLANVISGFAQINVKLMRPGEDTGSGDAYETKEYVGALTQPDIQIQGAEVSILMKGYGNAVFSTGPQYQFNFLGKTVGDVVSTCLDLIGYTKTEKDGHSSSINKKFLEKVIDQSKVDTPFAVLKWALGLYNLSFTEDLKVQNQIVIYDTEISHFTSEQAKYTFVQWRQIDLENNIFPLTNFSVDSAKSLFLSGRAFGNSTQGLNELQKKIIDSNNDPVNNDMEKQIVKASKLISDDPKLKGFVSFMPTQNSTEQTQTSKNQVVVGSSVYQKFTLETYGLSDIAPLDQVNLIIGDIQEFTGVLTVTKVTHTMDMLGWSTSMEATKIADMSQEISEIMGLPSAPVTSVAGNGSKFATFLA